MTEKERFTYFDVCGWNKDGFLNVMNGLDKKNNELKERIKELEKELQRCREWINSDKNDYELTLSFIKSKGFSLKDVLNYEKRKNGDVE